jgi:TrpR family transcriptional regulator, trp operon repressor
MAKKTQDKNFRSFLQLCLKVKADKQLEDLFELFFTIEERHVLSCRYLIIQALLKGELTQRELAKKYGVSIAQITRGSNALKTIDPYIKSLLEGV